MTDHFEAFMNRLRNQTRKRQEKLFQSSFDVVYDVIVTNNVMCSYERRNTSQFCKTMMDKYDMQYHQLKRVVN